VHQNLGLNVRRLRRSLDLTQEQLAARSGIRQPYLSAIERGLQPSGPLAERIAGALGVQVTELLRDLESNSACVGARQSAGTTQLAVIA
jgi:transcriptional regulator with XRE-family HTH domain